MQETKDGNRHQATVKSKNGILLFYYCLMRNACCLHFHCGVMICFSFANSAGGDLRIP
jgi:hypothetical protein